MELIDNHLFRLISKHDGEKYSSDEYTLEEARNYEKVKRKNYEIMVTMLRIMTKFISN